MEEKDRRRAPRFEAEGDVTLTFLGSEDVCKGQLKDISKNGIFVLTDKPPKEAWQNTGCRFHLVSTIDDNRFDIKGQAHVTRRVQAGMGLFLTTINPASRRSFVQLMIHVMNTLSKLT